MVPDAAPLHDWAGLHQRLVILAVSFLAALFSRSGCCRLRAGGADPWDREEEEEDGILRWSDSRPALRGAAQLHRHHHVRAG